MITPIPLLQSVRVASPCNADWNEMQSVEGDRVHFCMGCGKNVYNLSAMSQPEAEGLLRKHEGRLCVRYYQRRDGTVLTGDCPVGAQAVRMALIRRSVVAAGLFALMFGAMAGINRAEMDRGGLTPTAGAVAITPQPVAGGTSISIEADPVTTGEPAPKPEPMMGKMAVREPQVTMGMVAMPIKRVEVKTVPEAPYKYNPNNSHTSEKVSEGQSAYSAWEAPEKDAKDSTDEAIVKSRNEK
jgi:hypothetical protein